MKFQNVSNARGPVATATECGNERSWGNVLFVGNSKLLLCRRGMFKTDFAPFVLIGITLTVKVISKTRTWSKLSRNARQLLFSLFRMPGRYNFFLFWVSFFFFVRFKYAHDPPRNRLVFGRDPNHGGEMIFANKNNTFY